MARCHFPSLRQFSIVVSIFTLFRLRLVIVHSPPNEFNFFVDSIFIANLTACTHANHSNTIINTLTARTHEINTFSYFYRFLFLSLSHSLPPSLQNNVIFLLQVQRTTIIDCPRETNGKFHQKQNNTNLFIYLNTVHM